MGRTTRVLSHAINDALFFLSGVINPPQCLGHKESRSQNIEQRSHNALGTDPTGNPSVIKYTLL